MLVRIILYVLMVATLVAGLRLDVPHGVMLWVGVGCLAVSLCGETLAHHRRGQLRNLARSSLGQRYLLVMESLRSTVESQETDARKRRLTARDRAIRARLIAEGRDHGVDLTRLDGLTRNGYHRADLDAMARTLAEDPRR